MSRHADRQWVVLDSFENPEGDHCVDLFRRRDGTFGFEEFRRDPEDGGLWTPIRYFSESAYATEAEALDVARHAVSWLSEALARR